MSNQVYRNDKPAVPNVYISDILQPGPGGGAVVKSLTITDPPPLHVGDERVLMRNTTTGAVELAAGVIASRLILTDAPPLDIGTQRALTRDSVGGTVLELDGLLATSLTLSAVPTNADNDGFPFLVRDSATGVVKQRTSASVPFTGYTERHLDADQVIGNGVDTVVLYPINDHGDGALSYDPGTGTFTVLATGMWSISYTTAFGLSVVGNRYSWLTFNGGVARYAANNKISVNDSLMNGCQSTGLTSGETFQVHAFQDSGGPLAVQGLLTNGINFTSIAVTRVTPGSVF